MFGDLAMILVGHGVIIYCESSSPLSSPSPPDAEADAEFVLYTGDFSRHRMLMMEER